MEISTLEAAVKNGLSVVLAIGIFGLCVWLVKFVIVQLTDRMKELVTALDKLQTKIEIHDKAAEERGKYVREEHKQMIETLGRINGYKGG